jgi:hypothetical protein
VVVGPPVVVRVGLGGFVGFVGLLEVVVVTVVVVVVVVVVEGDDDGRDGRLVPGWVTGTAATGSVVVVVVCTGGAGWPWKSVVAGGGILINAMPSTTPAIADTTSAVLALITRSNGVLAARLTLLRPLRSGSPPHTRPIGQRFRG